jgi:hypothetical protein
MAPTAWEKVNRGITMGNQRVMYVAEFLATPLASPLLLCKLRTVNVLYSISLGPLPGVLVPQMSHLLAYTNVKTTSFAAMDG